MKKILSIVALCFLLLKITGQSYNQIYDQNEQLRLTNASVTEDEIENFITQYINT